jgi:hypothetical protein
MKRYRNHLIVAAVLSVLAVIGTIMNSRQASAQDGGPHVTIDSPSTLHNAHLAMSLKIDDALIRSW